MKKELELYLHIPFCVKKCAYCDFLSSPADESVRQEYVDTLIMEIQRYQKIYHDAYEITTIFIGGGTPSVLSGEQILRIFQALHKSFRITENVEITIEANPGTVTREKLLRWKQAGINRLSIGLQSVNDEELRMLGRIHTYQDFLGTYRMAREYGFQNVNIDLISAIPGQTIESWKKTLTAITELNPEHISAYSLIIEEGTPFYARYGNGFDGAAEDRSHNQTVFFSSLPDEETERGIYEMTVDYLTRFGYQRYEISNYAKKGFRCRHNQGYWERKDYLGIGLGASSLINHIRYHNTQVYKTYIKNVKEKADIREDIEALTLSEEIEEYMFLGLRETKGISIKRFKSLFGKNIFEIYGSQLKKLSEGYLLQISKDSISLTNRGIDVSNAVFTEFMEPFI